MEVFSNTPAGGVRLLKHAENGRVLYRGCGVEIMNSHCDLEIFLGLPCQQFSCYRRESMNASWSTKGGLHTSVCSQTALKILLPVDKNRPGCGIVELDERPSQRV